MRNRKFIPVNEPLLNGNEKKYLNECIETGWISSEGPFVEKFEYEFSKFVNRKFGVAVSSGTGAIDIAIECLELKPGDEIILPTFTIISCINQIVRSGLKPVLVDSDPKSLNINTNLIEKKITKKTRAIMVVHTYGLPVEMDPVISISKKYNLFLIEDAAEMHGQTYKNKPCGSFGDISIFSFYPNKHITTGEGGMLLTDNINFYNRAKSYRNLCFNEKNRFVHEKLGWNYRMTNLQAALGLAQLEQLNSFIQKKRNIGNLYNEYLSDLKDIQLPLKLTTYAENIYWVYSIILDNDSKIDAKFIMQKLKNLGVGCRPFFFPMHMQPVLQKMGFFMSMRYETDKDI